MKLKIPQHFLATMALMSCLFALTGCAALEQWSKPDVQGLMIAPTFNADTLLASGVNKASVKLLINNKQVSPQALAPQLLAAIHTKRPDIQGNQNQRYDIRATILANHVSQRRDDFDTAIYKYTARTVKVNYEILDNQQAGQVVWQGIIETSDENINDFKVDKKEKRKDKILDAVISKLTDTEINPQPYPQAPSLDAVLQKNFEGFALNLPAPAKS